jgi:uroporphyrinogen-III synthase
MNASSNFCVADPSLLAGWTVVAISTSAQNARLGRAARDAGARFVGLPVLRLRAAAPSDAHAGDDDVRRAIASPQCVFTSPAAVRFADRRLPLADYGGLALAVGSGTAAALRRAGVREVRHPQRMDSEGLLALPQLDPPADDIGLVGAPGGRGLLGPALASRGARVHVAHVYRREPGRLDRRHLAALATASDPLALLLTSADALRVLLTVLPGPLVDRLRDATVVAASPRLALLAGTHGFATLRQAASARWPALCAALCGHAKPGPFR